MPTASDYGLLPLDQPLKGTCQNIVPNTSSTMQFPERIIRFQAHEVQWKDMSIN